MLKAKEILAVLYFLSLTFVPVTAYAEPYLQLDIEGGIYLDAPTIVDPDEDGTTHSLSQPFNLYALINSEAPEWSASDGFNDTFYISAALISLDPSLAPVTTAGTYGSFSFAGTEYTITDDMLLGTPPVEVDLANKDLPSHGIYQTFYTEIPFTLSANTPLADLYNVADFEYGGIIGGGLTPNPNGTLYYNPFTVDTSNLDSAYGIHFDLYTMTTAKDGQFILGAKAPFSHDAQSSPGSPVPEPTSILLLGTGIVGLLGAMRKKGKGQQTG